MWSPKPDLAWMLSVDRGPKLPSFSATSSYSTAIPNAFRGTEIGGTQLAKISVGITALQMSNVLYMALSLTECYCVFLRGPFPGTSMQFPWLGWCFFSNWLSVPIGHAQSILTYLDDIVLLFALVSAKDSSWAVSHFQIFPSQNQSTALCSAHSKATRQALCEVPL